jgi:hypothetical protein
LDLSARLRGADLVARVATAELVDVVVDDRSENRRELGTFRLDLAEILYGETESTRDVLVVRDPDGPWPIPEEGEFIALLQFDTERRCVLVHDSAFPITSKGVRIDTAAGLGGRVRAEFVALKDVVAAVRRLAEQLNSYEAALADRETKRFKAEVPAPQEMPGDGLREWLDLDHTEGGRSAEPTRNPGPSRRRPSESED